MPQQYYTLEQAAQILQIKPEQLTEMARKKEIRAFQDRSGWRFRSQEIDEMARARGFGSDPELPLGEALKGKAGDSGHGKEVFNFSLDPSESDEVPLDKDPAASSGHGSRKSSGSKSPKPKASSDSDVRLVMEGDDVNFAVEEGKASASKGPISPPPKAPMSPTPGKPGSSKSRKAPMVQDDSGVRIVRLDQPSDSDVKLEQSKHDSDIGGSKKKPTKRASDSDIRIEEAGSSGKADQMVTEEIDLDAEQRKAEDASSKTGRQRPKPGSSPALPTTSPFELSESDIPVKKPAAAEGKPETDSSSDFELQPMEGSSDEIGLGNLSGGKGKTGISLQDPADSGISLVPESSEELRLKPGAEAAKPDTDSSSDFDLNVEGDSSPREGSSSEFELSLQEDDASPTEGSSSEFELSLDTEGSDLAEGSSELGLEKQGADSDSEFELTLDDSGGLSAQDESADSDSDFAMGEDSGSGAVALDEGETDLESAEFDLSLEGEESGSQVVPLEEEEADEGAATVQRRVPGAAVEGEEGLEDIGDELDEDLDEAPAAEGEVQAAAAPVAAAPPADWGVLVPLVSLFSTIVLFLVMLMGFELIHGMWGYHTGSTVSSPIVRFFAKTFTDEKLPE